MRITLLILLGCCGFLLNATASAEELQPKAVPAAGAANPPPADAGAEPQWQRFETKITPLSTVRQILSPGVLDPELQHLIVTPKDGSSVDILLPHFGQDKSGKDFPAILARFATGAVALETKGDGKPTMSSIFADDNYSEPFTTDIHYEDGTSAPYTFRLKRLIDKEKYLLIRNVARQFEFKGQTIVLLDEDGNGKYSDVDRDCVIVGNNPVTFLGKYIAVGDEFYEMLVHDAGISVELRKAPKMDVGTVKMLDSYKLPQKSEDLKIDTIIIHNADSSFSFDDRHPTAKVPVGAYDMVFGIFERKVECVYAKKGEKTSFTVAAGDQNVLPKYGGKITAQVEADSDGWDVFIHKPKFVGEAGENYWPENFKQSVLSGALALVYYDKAIRIEMLQDIGARRFTITPDGNVKDIVIRHYREKNEEYQAAVEYESGIMGVVIGKKRLDFVFKKKEKGDDKGKASDSKP